MTEPLTKAETDAITWLIAVAKSDSLQYVGERQYAATCLGLIGNSLAGVKRAPRSRSWRIHSSPGTSVFADNLQDVDRAVRAAITDNRPTITIVETEK